jgi:hypothetical protein
LVAGYFFAAFATVLAAIIATVPGFVSAMHGNKGNPLKNVELVGKITESLEHKDHKLVTESLFFAASNTLARYEEILSLASFSSPIYAIYYYSFGKSALVFDNNHFKLRYLNRKSRLSLQFRIKLLFTLSCVCVSAAALYVIYSASLAVTGKFFSLKIIVTGLVFPFAFAGLGIFSWKQRTALSCAVKLVEMQNIL